MGSTTFRALLRLFHFIQVIISSSLIKSLLFYQLISSAESMEKNSGSKKIIRNHYLWFSVGLPRWCCKVKTAGQFMWQLEPTDSSHSQLFHKPVHGLMQSKLYQPSGVIWWSSMDGISRSILWLPYNWELIIFHFFFGISVTQSSSWISFHQYYLKFY